MSRSESYSASVEWRWELEGGEDLGWRIRGQDYVGCY